MKDTLFQTGTRYQTLMFLGEGAYGCVRSAYDKDTAKMVAVKKLSPFDHHMACVRLLRELKLLRFLREKCNYIVQVLDLVRPDSVDQLKDVYIVLEKMDSDLHRVLRIQNTKKLTDQHCQYFMAQILAGIHYLHDLNIIHRDLKPSNILVNSNCELRIADFGLARAVLPKMKNSAAGNLVISVENKSPLEKSEDSITEYVATRWYRAPELMLDVKEYNNKVDIWSAGCILGEMITQKALFPGKDYSEQLTLIIEGLGGLTADDLTFLTLEKMINYVKSLPAYNKLDLKRMLTTQYGLPSSQALSLIHGLLKFNPSERYNIEQSVAHPYVLNYAKRMIKTPTSALPMSIFELDLIKNKLSRAQLKKMIWNELNESLLSEDVPLKL